MITTRSGLVCFFSVLLTFAAAAGPVGQARFAGYKGKTNIAHRGASSYAPEHTAAAYKLAIEQGADYVEQDLQVTKDGQLVCLHDLTLERTTNVKELFPGRARPLTREGREMTGWHVSDFTLAEIKQLDAGSWFDPRFKGERILTFQEAIEIVKGKAGIYPETKAPEVYGSLGFDMEKMVMDVLAKNGLDKPGADPKTPVFVQSFSADSLKKMRQSMKVALPLLFLVTDRDRDLWLTRERMPEIKTFADGIGPAKGIIAGRPEIVTWAHNAGLSVTVNTVTATATVKDVRDEMRQFLDTFGVDAVFTNNPDQFPRR
ncbi:MAG: glycerophosphodiester phosphodiesterase [Acidobacteria bacterium]|nr:MAG: glycerophosphodiester phosphodiesterase [Acidobacteriota bacterium]